MPVSPKAVAVPTDFTSASDREFDHYSSKKTFFFPGQGAQSIGMGVQLATSQPAAKQLFDRASKILGYDLLALCKNGPKSELDKTEICQPAVFVHSMAAIEKLRAESGDVEANSGTVCLGLSLGEYTALCYAGAITFEDCVRITKERGKAMQEAAQMVETGMASVIGLNVEQVEEVIQRVEEATGDKLRLANYLCEGNYVVSGTKKACNAVENVAKGELKPRMVVPLAVAGAFHTHYMQPAVEPLSKLLDTVEIKKPRIPVISNVDARPHSDPEVIRQLLKKQVVSPVMWEQSMKGILSKGFASGYEVGPGMVLRGILAKMDLSKEKLLRNIY